MNHWRTQRILLSNSLAEHWRTMGTAERKNTISEAKYCQLMIQAAIKDLRHYRTTGELPPQTDEDTDIEDMKDLARLLQMQKNARSNISKCRKSNNQKCIDKWEKITARIMARIEQLKEP